MGWTVVRLREVLEQIQRPTPIEPDEEYRLLGMRSQIGGPFLRETKRGSEISARGLNQVNAGDFIYSRLFAWQGSFGVIPEELDRCYVSNEFPIFAVDEARVDPRFLVFWFGLPQTQRMIEADCFGSTPGTRNRYKEEYFFKLEAPCPPLDEQHRIVAKLDTVAALVGERSKAIEAAEHDVQAMLANAFRQIIDGVPYRPISEVAPLVRRPVEIEPDRSYPELGVRSFGRGTFHKPSLSGMEVGSKKLFRIHEGDLLFNIVFAWEGAVAVAKHKDHGCVGSHRFLTCVPDNDRATADFLRFYFLTPEGLQKLGDASPGGAGRNRTLGLKKLDAITVPILSLDRQRWFDRLRRQAGQVEILRESAGRDAEALLPALLHGVFKEGESYKPD